MIPEQNIVRYFFLHFESEKVWLCLKLIFKLNAIEGKTNNDIHSSTLLELLVFPLSFDLKLLACLGM